MRVYEHRDERVVYRPACGRVPVTAQVAIQDIAFVTLKVFPPDEADAVTVRHAVEELQPTWDTLRGALTSVLDEISGQVRSAFQVLTAAGLARSGGEP